MDRMQQALDAAGVVLPLEAFGQGYVSMSPALDALEADLLQERLRHGGHPALAMCAANAVAVPDPAGNRKLDKSKATGRIDGMVALAMAEGVEAMTSENTVSVDDRSEEHTSELQSLMRISYAVFCLKKKRKILTCMI